MGNKPEIKVRKEDAENEPVKIEAKIPGSRSMKDKFPDKPLPKGAKVITRKAIQFFGEMAFDHDMEIARLELAGTTKASTIFAKFFITWQLEPVYCRSQSPEHDMADKSKGSRTPVILKGEQVLSRNCPICNQKVERLLIAEYECKLTKKICMVGHDTSGDCRKCNFALIHRLPGGKR